MEIRRSRGCVYALEYHMVWCVKYRRRALVGRIAEDAVRILREEAAAKGMEIMEAECDRDHVHILIAIPPRIPVCDAARILKGVTARKLFAMHGDELRKMLWGGHLWNPSYFAATVSENTEEQIRRYIREQGAR